jgi:GH18 family chitinase
MKGATESIYKVVPPQGASPIERQNTRDFQLTPDQARHRSIAKVRDNALVPQRLFNNTKNFMVTLDDSSSISHPTWLVSITTLLRR